MTTEVTPNTTAASVPTSKRKRALTILAIVVVIAGIAWALWYLLVARWHESTDDAYVQGNVVAITPQAPGTVVSIGADDGMKVDAGQVLVQLDPNDARVAYEQAVANLANTVRQVRGADRGCWRAGSGSRTGGHRGSSRRGREGARRREASRRPRRQRRGIGRRTGACPRRTRRRAGGIVVFE